LSVDSPSSELTAKQRLLNAAIDVFADLGYEGATVREICGRAGANVNAVKYYFEDKRGLYIAALRHSHAGVHAQLMEAAPQEATPEERLKWFITNTLRTMLARRGRDTHHLLLVRELTNPTEGTEEIVRMFIQPRFQMLCDTLREIAPHLPASRIRLLGYSVIGQCMHYKMAMPIVQMLTPKAELKSYDADHLGDHIFDVMMASVRL